MAGSFPPLFFLFQPSCLKFADPYVEHDTLTLLLDLILLKRDVFRHLLFNRGYEPRRASEAGKGGNDKRGDAKEDLTMQGQELVSLCVIFNHCISHDVVFRIDVC